MMIDGRLIASQIKADLKEKIAALRQKNIIPHLAVVFIGNDPGSVAYVGQKQKVGEELGIKVSLFKIAGAKNTSGDEETLRHLGGVRSTPPRWRKQKKELLKLVNKLNSDPSVHGIIIQRPVPLDISKEELDQLVVPNKDVDGFHPNSPFTPPIASAVIKILKWVYKGVRPSGNSRSDPDFQRWLNKKGVLVIGRGETAGKPIAETLKKMGIKLEIAHSKTTNLKEMCLASHIIITCVGRPDIVRHQYITKKTTLIGVGLHQENGKLLTDYDQKDIEDKVVYFTPVPGGVGPVNVACLFENLIKATDTY